MRWLNEPPRWERSEGTLEVLTGDRGDFWRTTHYGFVRDSGHFFYQEAEGDFVAEVRFSARYRALYDQAGLMLRQDEQNWIKAGVEYTDGLMHLSAVVTLGRSDWSVLPLEGNPPEVRLRLVRQGEAVRVMYALGEADWRMLRLCPFPAGAAAVGPMCCSPERAGLEAEFRGFAVRALRPEDTVLHPE